MEKKIAIQALLLLTWFPQEVDTKCKSALTVNSMSVSILYQSIASVEVL